MKPARDERDDLWPPKNLAGKMADQYLLAAAHGDVATLLPGLVEPTTEWASVTPYLPVRHRKKRQSAVEFLLDDLQHEATSRGHAAPVEIDLIDSAAARREISQYRRRRNHESMNRTRSGVHVRLRLAEPESGPLLLGQLSHFGYGIFAPAI